MATNLSISFGPKFRHEAEIDLAAGLSQGIDPHQEYHALLKEFAKSNILTEEVDPSTPQQAPACILADRTPEIQSRTAAASGVRNEQETDRRDNSSIDRGAFANDPRFGSIA